MSTAKKKGSKNIAKDSEIEIFDEDALDSSTDPDDLDEGSLNLYTGDLTPNNNNTVQPIALMRLGLFVPTLKGTRNSKRNKSNEIDASKELVQLEGSQIAFLK